jgi:sugar lactone lactonase YvrE
MAKPVTLLNAACAIWAAAACAPRTAATPIPSESATLVATVSGLSGPEAVRYDPEQDVYFVANFNGRSDARDNNGFISRVTPDGEIGNREFVAGGRNAVTLHAPRGMLIAGDTLWAVDVDAVRGFHRRTGAAVATIDFSAYDIGFLNDIARGADGALYVTDTGRNRIYQIRGRTVGMAVQDSVLNRPNGITHDAANNRFIVVPFGGAQRHQAWVPGQALAALPATVPGGRFDGVELIGGRLLVASQADSSLWAVQGEQVRRVTRTTGAPADIGVDTRRKRVAVPYIALNRVDIYQLPRGW